MAMKILIVGAGVAGPTLAYWLNHYGFEVTLVEKAPALRTGGYIIDFWGAGFEIADRMGLVEEIRSKGYLVEEVRVVNGAGKRIAGFPAEAFAKVTRGRYLSIPRSELAAAIFRKSEGKIEARFGESIEQIEQNRRNARVVFTGGLEREFDIVIGADGLHSQVRQLVFGPQSNFEKYLGYMVAGFQAKGYGLRDELAYVMYSEVGQQIARFSLRDDMTMFLFSWSDPSGEVPDSPQSQKALLRKRFAASGWESKQILDALDETADLYFDRVSQIHMPPEQGLWSRGRATLTGDAAFCVSFLAGQGTALAMVAAYVVAGELHRAKGDYAVAFDRYQRLFGPFVLKKQKAALRFAGAFAPKSKFSMFLRNRILDLFNVGWVAELAFGRDLADRISVPEY